jgi:4a-hydroxytetrahydrobiopterin dehydratase
MKLSKKKCIPCEDKTLPSLKPAEAKKLLKEIPGWKIEKGSKAISRTFLFGDFKEALRFVNQVGKIAEHEGHHPDIALWYNKVELLMFTHSVRGLSENDFIVAAKINEIV